MDDENMILNKNYVERLKAERDREIAEAKVKYLIAQIQKMKKSQEESRTIEENFIRMEEHINRLMEKIENDFSLYTKEKIQDKINIIEKLPVEDNLVEEMTDTKINKIIETKEHMANEEEISKPKEDEIPENKENKDDKEKPLSPNPVYAKQTNMKNNKKAKVSKTNKNNQQKEEEAKYTSSIWHAAILGINSDLKYWLKINPNNINLKNDEDQTPLQLAVSNEHYETVKLLINYGANVNIKEKGTSFTPLHIAVGNDNLPIVRSLLEAGADTEVRDLLDNTPILLSCFKREVNLDIIKELVAFGANFNVINKEQLTPLLLIALDGNCEIIKYLVDNGAKIDDTEEKDPFTALHLVARKGCLSCLKYLISKGANVNAATLNHFTPLFIALDNNNFEMVKYLIQNGADLNCKLEKNKTALHFSIESNDIKFLRLLIENGANINAQDSRKLTPLHYATIVEDKNKIKILIENGADINAQDINGATVLHLAIFCNNTTLFRYILSKGANINMKDKLDRTPLMIALGRNQDMAKTLAKKGANLFHSDINFDIIREVFPEEQYNQIMLFISNGMSIDKLNDFFRYGILNELR